jgi:hypothetical protein
MARHPKAGSVDGLVSPHNPENIFPRRYRLAGGKGALRGCPLRNDYDDHGVMKPVACADIQGTIDSCKRCQR